MITYEYSKDSIGGWLGLLLGTMVLRAIMLSTDLFPFIGVVFTPGLPGLFPITALLQFGVIAMTVWAVYLVVIRNPKFRLVFSASVLAQFVWAILIYQLYYICDMKTMELTEATKTITSTIVYGAIWIMYVYRSKRLRNRLDVIDVTAEVNNVDSNDA